MPMVPTFTVVRSTGEVPGFAPCGLVVAGLRPSPRPVGPYTFTVPTVCCRVTLDDHVGDSEE
jgi:hypothetical protein